MLSTKASLSQDCLLRSLSSNNRNDGNGDGLFWSAIIGLALTAFMVIVTEYYTSTEYSPVKKIAEASETGHATNIIATGRFNESHCTSSTGRLLSIWALTCLVVSMELRLLRPHVYGMIVALDAFGPITDNAGGIAEMAELPPEIRGITDPLDAVGNTTKAVTKGYAIGSAGLAALDHLHFTANLESEGKMVQFMLNDPAVIIGYLWVNGAAFSLHSQWKPLNELLALL